MKNKNYKYYPLEQYLLLTNENELKLSFISIEEILVNKLPQSAYEKLEWWSYNDNTHTQSKAWTTANFKPQVFLKEKYVIFKRVD